MKGGSLCAAEMKLEALAKESENRIDISDHGRSMSLPGSKERVLKFELQMYKMRDGEYCIDIQVCNQLRVLPCGRRTLAVETFAHERTTLWHGPPILARSMYPVCLMPFSVAV